MEQIQTPNQKPIESQLVKSCANCNATEKQLLRCTRCRKAYYCDVQCQKKHWPTHKITCSRPQQNKPSTEKDKNTTSTTNQSTNKEQKSQNEFHSLNQFEKLTHIGSGNFSQIFKTVSKIDGKTYAIKQVQKAKVQRIRKQADLFMQKHCLSKLKDCDYVIKLYRTFQDQMNLFIQMECPENGELWDKCKTFGFFSSSVFKYYAAHLVKALSIIHEQYQIVHRDLKPQNILLTNENKIKLIDFGTAKDLSRPDIQGSGNGVKGKKVFQHYVGTPNYMSPQCIHNKASQKKSDIYSLSGIFYFMKVGSPPFTGGSEFIIFKKNLENNIFLCQQLFSPSLRDLILKMNEKEISQRYDITQVMQHEYFSDIDWENMPTFQDSIAKCSDLQRLLEQQGNKIYEKYYKLAFDGTIQSRKSAYDNELGPYLQNLKQRALQNISQEQQEWLNKRIEIMKIQSKVMLNYFNDNSTGFAQVYNNDFDSAQRVISQVKKSKPERKNKQIDHNSEDEDQQLTEEQQVNMKKNKD